MEIEIESAARLNADRTSGLLRLFHYARPLGSKADIWG